ncbi:MAG: Glu-tRNAGln amidotransferase subunit [Patescibacteria group bacterium]|nr:Glu-tRNAGln amidotransferase subunit [Patescibacteria group bacterium]
MLARVGVPEAELDQVAGEIDAIVGYIDILNTVNVEDIVDMPLQVNVTHADANATTTGTYFDTLIAAAPDSQDGFYKVPKIL